MENNAITTSELGPPLPELNHQLIHEEIDRLLVTAKGDKNVLSHPGIGHTGYWYVYTLYTPNNTRIKDFFDSNNCRVHVRVETTDGGCFGVVQTLSKKPQRPSFIRDKLKDSFVHPLKEQEIKVYKVGSPFSIYFLLYHSSYSTGHAWKRQCDPLFFHEFVHDVEDTKWTSYSGRLEFMFASNKPNVRLVEAIKLLSENRDDVTVSEVLRIFPELIGGLTTLEKGAELLSHGTKVSEDLPLEPLADPIGIWFSGGPGTGKTSLVKDICERIQRHKPGSIGFIMSGKAGGFFEGIFRENEIIVCDEFNWDKLSAEVILSIISPQEVLLNKKGSSVRLRRKKCLIIIANYDLEYYVSSESFSKVWKSIDPEAIRRRFILINLGNPSKEDLESVSVAHKGAYATQVVGNLLTTLVTDLLLDKTLRQQTAVEDPLREALKDLVSTQIMGSTDSKDVYCDSPPKRRASSSNSFEASGMHFTQTTPFKKYSDKKDELKKDELNVGKKGVASNYDMIATGQRTKHLPSLTRVRCKSPTMRTYKTQFSLLGEEVLSLRIQNRTAEKLYPPGKKFTRGLLGKRFEDLHANFLDQDYQALCWDSFEKEYEELFDEGLIVPKPFLKINQVGKAEAIRDNSSEEGADKATDEEDNQNGGICLFESQRVASPMRESQTVYEDLCPGAVPRTRNESPKLCETLGQEGVTASQLLRGTASPEVKNSEALDGDQSGEIWSQHTRKSKRIRKNQKKDH